jgi:hypothetical protein
MHQNQTKCAGKKQKKIQLHFIFTETRKNATFFSLDKGETQVQSPQQRKTDKRN